MSSTASIPASLFRNTSKENVTASQQPLRTSSQQQQHIHHYHQAQQTRSSQHKQLQQSYPQQQKQPQMPLPQQQQQQQRPLQPSPSSDNRVEQQVTKNKGVQVDWTVFAENDNQEIKSMFLLNLEDKEIGPITVKEIKMYRQREFNLLGHLNDYRKRTEDLSRKISLREMQLGRLESALLKHKEMLVEAKGKERELQFLVSDLRLTIEDLNEKHKEEAVLSKLRDAEHGELVDQLKSKIHKSSAKQPKETSGKKSKNTNRANHQSIDFLATPDETVKLAQNGTVKLSASLGSISPTRKSFSAFTGSGETRRRSDDNGKSDERDFPFESDSDNEIPSDLSSSSDGLRHHSKAGRRKTIQRKHHSNKRSNGESLSSRPSLGNGPVNGKSSMIHISRSPNVNHHRRRDCQNLVPLQHSPQRHRGSNTFTPDERRNMLLNSLVQDFA